MKNNLIKEDKKYVWHPFTQMSDWVKDEPSTPVVIEKGRGNYIYDVNGKKYLDGVSSLWVTLHGHANRVINRRISQQLSKIAHSTFLGLTHGPAVKLAKELVKITPQGLTRVFYSDNGSTAVEIALKMAYQYWHQTEKKSKRDRFLSLKNAYHGDTIGSVSVGGIDLFHSIFRPLLYKTYYAPSPYCYRCRFRVRGYDFGVHSKNFLEHCRRMGCKGQCVKEFEKILKKYHKRIAAVVLEPMIQGAAGMLTMPPGYLKEIDSIRRKYKTLLICDEVATGFGRTGKMFATEFENIKPDFLCLAKGITGGYLPLAATLATEKIYRGFLGKYEEFKTFFHGHTYTANPLGCAAALANLEIFRKSKVLKKLPEKIGHMSKELKKLAQMECVGNIRQLGLMVGIELVKDKKKIVDFSAQQKTGARVCAECRKYGLMIRPLSNVIVLMPPLSITNHEISRMIAIVRKCILKICKK
ncbi:MAG: adenosylmethionine--8-amino-7-oxononanoate transaminase [Endomicrobiales bacterium]|nr:adenosylmethionine--8-amino-7-oxononanoate transaminase [Endomicrobiales bacterium]